MLTERIYLISLQEEAAALEKKLSDPSLPTIDLDMVKWSIMEVFSQIDPHKSLLRLAKEMVRHDWLFSKIDHFSDCVADSDTFIPITREQACERDRQIRDFIRKTLVDFGLAVLNNMQRQGFFHLGTERYTVTSRPLHHDHTTYIFKRTRG